VLFFTQSSSTELRGFLRRDWPGARAEGHGGGERTGDIWRLPGVFLVQGARVLWSHEYRYAGDHPEWDRIPAPVAANSVASG